MRLLILSVAVFLISGCSSRLYVPASYSPDQGKAIIGAIQDESLEVFLEHIEQSGKHLVFDLEIINKSDQSVLVDPQKIFYYGAYSPFPGLTNGENVRSAFGHAIDGAREVYALDEDAVNRDIRSVVRTQQAIGIVLAVAAAAVVVNDIVKDEEDYSSEYISKSKAQRAQNRDIVTFASLVTVDMIQSGLEVSQMKKFADLEYLPDEYLHEQALLPGSSMRGKVFLPVREVDHLRVVVPIGSRDYIFDFREASQREMREIR
jgi:hypothetical protein